MRWNDTRIRFPAWRADLRVVAILVVAGACLFGPSLNDGFHFDDELILADSNVTNADRWTHFFNPLRLRQVTFFTFYLNHRIGGDDAFGYHVVNVGLHVLNGILLYLLLGPLAGGWAASAAALIFLTHPVQVEAVHYVYQRSTLLATFFSLAALAVLARRANDSEGERKRIGDSAVWAAVVLFALAAASKESALAVPLVLAIVVGSRRHVAWIVGIVTAVGAFALALLAWLGEETVGIGAWNEVSPATYLRTELGVFLSYLRLLVLPLEQSVEYDVAPVGTWWNAGALAGLLAIVAFTTTAIFLIRRSTTYWTGIGVLAFLILLAPTSSLIPSLDFAFEHRLYLPMSGFALVAGILISRTSWRLPVAVSIVAVLGALTWSRGQVWADDVVLWEDTVQKAPGKARAWFNLGGAYMEAGDLRAQAVFERALELDPGSVETAYNLGILEQREGNAAAAIRWYEHALALDSAYWPATNNIGNVRFGAGQYPEANRQFFRVLELNPDYWPAQYNLALVYTALSRPDLAEPRLRIVLDWSPDFAEARNLLALSLQRMGREQEAREQLEILGGGIAFPVDPNPEPLAP